MKRLCLSAIALCLATACAPHATQSACRPTIFKGSGRYVRTSKPLQGPGLLLEGGGTDIDAGFRWMHATLSGGSKTRFGNVVVLRADGTDDYDSFIASLGPFQSVRTILIPPCAAPRQVDALAPQLEGADAVFFAGGDQADYVRWKPTALVRAIRTLWRRGGVIGGTSAGLAIQGAMAYDSVAADRLHPNDDAYEVRSPSALRHPFEPEISFTNRMFAWPPLENTITDTHFVRRKRFGRLVVFLARIEREKHLRTGTFYGLGIDERSELTVDARGMATLREYAGPGYRTQGAYLIHLLRVHLVRGKPLTAIVQVLHLDKAGATVNLVTKRGDGATYDVEVK